MNPEPEQSANTRVRRAAKLLAVVAVVMATLTAWRLANPHQKQDSSRNVLRRPAPSFQLYEQGTDSRKPRIVNLEAYLHRHQIVIVFFDGQSGPENNPVLVELRKFYDALHEEGIIVLGISTALPQQNRSNSITPFPFALLSDVTATAKNSVHRTWGCFVEPVTLDQPARTKPAVFVIDRAGTVAWEGSLPLPESNPRSVVARLLSRPDSSR